MSKDRNNFRATTRALAEEAKISSRRVLALLRARGILPEERAGRACLWGPEAKVAVQCRGIRPGRPRGKGRARGGHGGHGASSG